MDKPRKDLTFQQLDEQVDAYIKITEDAPPSAVERWSFAIALFAAGFALLIGNIADGPIASYATWIGLAVEILAFAVFLIRFIKRNWKIFRQSRRSYAIDLDGDYGEFLKFVNWLKTFCPVELSQKLRYVRGRKNSMIYRLGLLTGGVERLGVLPVLVALYLQFKDWEFGDWESIGQINVVGGSLLWILLLLYAAGWWLIGLKTRLDTYETLLAEATNDS